jgi:Family of unknown function (DUF6152)
LQALCCHRVRRTAQAFAVKQFFLTVGLAAILLGAPALAHHSFAMFDLDKRGTLTGTVREFQFTNPHCWIQLLVKTGESADEWSIEMGSPAHLIRAGWKPNTLKPGEKVTVVYHPLRDGTRGGSFISASTADGKPIGVPP